MHGHARLLRRGPLLRTDSCGGSLASPTADGARATAASRPPSPRCHAAAVPAASLSPRLLLRPPPLARPALEASPSPSARRRSLRWENVAAASGGRGEGGGEGRRGPLFHLARAMAVAVLVPVLAFLVVSGFVARMGVVVVVGLSLVRSVAQSVEGERVSAEARGDLVASAAVYAGVMAVVASVMT